MGERIEFSKSQTQAMADVLGLFATQNRDKVVSPGMVRDWFAETMKKYTHEHYQSIIGPYCAACHIDLPGPHYDTWADGQRAV